MTFFEQVKDKDEVIRHGKPYPEAVLKVCGKDDNFLYCFPEGGGFQMKFPKDKANEQLRLVTDEDKAEWREAIFEHDGVKEGETFKGYTKGFGWNGWATPNFPKETADKIARIISNEPCDPGTIKYNKKLDRYEYTSTENDPEEWEAGTIEVNGEKIKVYGIGSYSWTWREKQPEGEED